MISKNRLNNIIHKIHLDGFIDSQKRFLKDNRGGFLIPLEAKITDKEYERYRYLPINWSIPSITKDDLPSEFSQKAVNTINMFRKKTYDLNCECMIYFDYVTGVIVSCNFSDEKSPYEVEGYIYEKFLKNMSIASAHNHPKQYYSPPSGKNFEMLGLKFEEFEIISAQDELWILESREITFEESKIDEIRKKTDNLFNQAYDEVNKSFKSGYAVIDNVDNLYGNYLLNYLNNYSDNIKLVRRILNE